MDHNLQPRMIHSLPFGHRGLMVRGTALVFFFLGSGFERRWEFYYVRLTLGTNEWDTVTKGG